MKTIIFIGSNKSGSSYDAIKAAESMNYYTVLLTDKKSFEYRRTELSHVHLMKLCNIGNIDDIRQVINSLSEKYLDIYAIVSFIEPYCHTASLLSREYGLKYFSSEAIFAMLDKIKSREILDGSAYSPFFYKIDDGNPFKFMKRAAAHGENFPLVLKLPASAGSKDVHRAETYGEYLKTFSEIKRNYPNESVLAEEYLEGPQYLVETMTVNNKIYIIAVVEQEITFTGRFIVTGYKIILDREGEFYRSLKEAVGFVINKHGMKDGPCHLEFRHVRRGKNKSNKSDWKLIEANPRISGGAMNIFIETAYGINLVRETLKFALGDTPDLEYKHKKETFLQYVIVPKEGRLIKVTGKNAALNCRGVEHVYIKPKKESLIIPPVSMAYRYAYVIASGKTPDDAEKNAKYGAARITFHLREIDAYGFSRLGKSEKQVLNISEKNKIYLNRLRTSFDNYILYDRYGDVIE
jgi:biotin carboxylase